MLLPRLVILTGLSGAGKTQALRCLEDIGFFCVDNLPPSLIPKFADLCAQAAVPIQRIALVVDVRGGELFDTVFEVLAELDREAVPYEIVFLEAAEEVLVRRFKESRRPHPVGGDDLLHSIREERARLEELRGRAHKIIDTTALSVQQLKEQLNNLFGTEDALRRFRTTLLSFGYKYGIPLDADLVIDVRFLPNPHYVSRLRPLTGENAAVKEYVFASPVTGEFLAKFSNLIEFLIPLYIKEGKTMLTVAIGCTGGCHRSVVIANRLAEILAAKDYQVVVRHRDVQRDSQMTDR
uniref:RNase adapter RapZ n=1 Tax=Ammonifex degensii TaxID=42838 RepID=A0A7C2E375_9THEO